MTRKILITGGAGFIGGFLGQSLAARGDEVHLLDNFSRGKPDHFLHNLQAQPNVRILSLDLTTPHATAALDDDYDVIFHLAALLGVANVLERPYPTLRDNVALLAEVIQFGLRQKKLQRFVFASTSEVYAGSLLHMDMPIPTPEDFPLALPDLAQPRTSYMLSKIYGEAMVTHSGLPYTILRPHNIYGPRMGLLHVVPQLLEKAHKAPAGGHLEVFSVEHRRTFCFVDDAVAMMIAAAEKADCHNQTLNLGNEAPEITMMELAQIVIATTGKSLTIQAAPATAGSPARRAPQMTKMTRLTGVAAHTSVETGVRRTYDWYREHIFSGKETEVAR